MTARVKVKTVQILCRLSPSLHATATCVLLKEERHIIVISSGNNLIHLVEGNKIKGIINLHSPIVKILDFPDVLKEHVLVITGDGKLWAVSIQINEISKQAAIPIDIEMAPNNTNYLDVFAELLSPDSQSTRMLKTLPNPIIQCPEENVVHWEPDLQCVAIGADHVITCAQNDGLRLSVYTRVNSLQDNSKEQGPESLQITPNKIIEISSIPQYRIKLASDRKTDIQPKNAEAITVLLYLEPGDETPTLHSTTTLDHQLFHHLFKTEFGSKLPVVVIGRASGMVSYIPVGISTPPKLLYHLEQQVVAIFVARPARDSSTNRKNKNSDTLVLVGALGKLVVVKQCERSGSEPSGLDHRISDPRRRDPRGLDTGRSEPRDVQFRVYHVPGSIVCSALHPCGSVWFYSTLKEVFAVCLKFVKQFENGDDPRSSSFLLPTSLMPIALKLPKVSAMVFEKSCLGAKVYSLVCIKTDGHVVLLREPLPYIESLDGKCTSVRTAKSNRSGETIKRYLSEIQKKSDCVTCLTNEIRELEDIIKQLNVVTHVLCTVLTNQDNPESYSPDPGISFTVDVDYELQGGSCNPSVILRCVLVNSTKFPLARGWVMVVQVRTMEPWYNEDGQALHTGNHSVPLGSSSSHHISIPLEPSLSYLYPIEVSCYICFHIKDILPGSFSELDLKEEGFAVLVKNIELNILNFLRTVNQETVTATARDSQTEIFQQTVKKLNNLPQTISTPKSQSKTHGSSTLSLRLSQGAVAFIKKTLDEQNSAAKLPGKINSEEQCVLNFLLFKSMKHFHWDEVAIRGNYVILRTPREDQVKFQVVRLDPGTCGTGVEVHVYVSSGPLRCSVHGALLNLFKPVLQREPEKNSKIPLGQLQKRLTKLKKIHTSLDLLHQPHFAMETDQDLRYQNTLEKLFNIYDELRKIPTMIL